MLTTQQISTLHQVSRLNKSCTKQLKVLTKKLDALPDEIQDTGVLRELAAEYNAIMKDYYKSLLAYDLDFLIQ